VPTLASSDERIESLLISSTDKTPPGTGCVCELGNNNRSIGPILSVDRYRPCHEHSVVLRHTKFGHVN